MLPEKGGKRVDSFLDISNSKSCDQKTGIMTMQDRFDTCLNLLKKEGRMTQMDISCHLKENGLPQANPPYLSRAKSKVDLDGFKTDDGEFNQRKLTPLVEKLETLLGRFNIVFVDGAYYQHMDTFKKFYNVYHNNHRGPFPQGVVKVHDQFPRNWIQEAIGNAKKVRLLQTFMTSMEDYVEAFKKCLKKGGHIQILLLDPRGTVAKVRSRGIKEKAVDVEQKVVQNVKMLEELTYKPHQLEIKFYDDFPGLEMYSIDDRMFCGWYLLKQLAKDGTYLELKNDDHYHLPREFNQNWKNLWAQANLANEKDRENSAAQEFFKCHYLRNGEYNHFKMRINKLSSEVFVTQTKSGDEFKGHFENENGRFLGICAETVNKFVEGKLHEVKKRMASFLIYTGHNGLWEQALSVGVFTNIIPSGSLVANMVLIENLRKDFQSSFPLDRQAFLLEIQQFLKASELKADDIADHSFEGLDAYLQAKNPQWREQLNRYTLVSGQFHLFLRGRDDSGVDCICRRPLKITGGTLKAKREVWLEGRHKVYDVLMPDSVRILLTSINPNIADSEFIYLHRKMPALNQFTGFLFAIDAHYNFKQTEVLMLRNDETLKPEDYIIYFGSEQFQELCQINDFKRLFAKE